MLYKLSRLLWTLSNRDYIPKLPRGMLATKYEETEVSAQQWRVLDRIGARDPAGIKRAMKKYGVDNLDDLVAMLEHHKPKRHVRRRLMTALGRLAPGSYTRDPHEKEVKRAMKMSFEVEELIKIRDRIERIKRYDG